MQDPALIVSEQGRILDINPATAAAARVRREDIIGKGVCEVLHGGRSPGAICPLETLLHEKKPDFRNRTARPARQLPADRQPPTPL